MDGNDSSIMTPVSPAEWNLDFDAPMLFDILNQASPEDLDRVPFGIVRMNAAMEVVAYNRAEAELSGLDPTWVLGKHFFREVAPCTDNVMVSAKYLPDADLDEHVDYVLSFHMRPVRVRLRLLRRRANEWSYFCVHKL